MLGIGQDLGEYAEGSTQARSDSKYGNTITILVPLAGLEPALPAPEASALSSELQGHTSIIL